MGIQNSYLHIILLACNRMAMLKINERLNTLNLKSQYFLFGNGSFYALGDIWPLEIEGEERNSSMTVCCQCHTF